MNISTALFPPFKLKYFDLRGSPASALSARQTFRTAVRVPDFHIPTGSNQFIDVLHPEEAA
jgi:hypothetical protein